MFRSRAMQTFFSRSLKSVAAQDSKMPMSAVCPPVSAIVRGDALGWQCRRLLQLYVQLKSQRLSAGAPPVNVRGSIAIPVDAVSVRPANLSFPLWLCVAKKSQASLSRDLDLATRPVDGEDHVALFAPDHTGRIQRLRDTWAKNLRSLEQPQPAKTVSSSNLETPHLRDSKNCHHALLKRHGRPQKSCKVARLASSAHSALLAATNSFKSNKTLWSQISSERAETTRPAMSTDKKDLLIIGRNCSSCFLCNST